MAALLCVFVLSGLPRAARASHEGKLAVVWLGATPVIGITNAVALTGILIKLKDDVPGRPTGWAVTALVSGSAATLLGLWVVIDPDLRSPELGTSLMVLGATNVVLGIVGLNQDEAPDSYDPRRRASVGVGPMPGGGVGIVFGGGF
jgi:hypothetical protein